MERTRLPGMRLSHVGRASVERNDQQSYPSIAELCDVRQMTVYTSLKECFWCHAVNWRKKRWYDRPPESSSDSMIYKNIRPLFQTRVVFLYEQSTCNQSPFVHGIFLRLVIKYLSPPSGRFNRNRLRCAQLIKLR